MLVIDETRRSGNIGQRIVKALVKNDFRGGIARVASADSCIPLGDAALPVLLKKAENVDAAGELCERG
ncbi:hypothetical protein ACWDTI_23760 [Gordonia sp. NPDC003424]